MEYMQYPVSCTQLLFTPDVFVHDELQNATSDPTCVRLLVQTNVQFPPCSVYVALHWPEYEAPQIGGG